MDRTAGHWSGKNVANNITRDNIWGEAKRYALQGQAHAERSLSFFFQIAKRLSTYAKSSKEHKHKSDSFKCVGTFYQHCIHIDITILTTVQRPHSPSRCKKFKFHYSNRESQICTMLQAFHKDVARFPSNRIYTSSSEHTNAAQQTCMRTHAHLSQSLHLQREKKKRHRQFAHTHTSLEQRETHTREMYFCTKINPSTAQANLYAFDKASVYNHLCLTRCIELHSHRSGRCASALQRRVEEALGICSNYFV